MTLTVSRAADRRRIADQLVEIAAKHGAHAVKAEGRHYPGPRAILVRIETPEGLEVGIDLDGSSREPDTFVLPWYVGHRHKVEMTPALGTVAGAEVNPFHRQKCTAVAWSVPDMLAQVDAVLALNASGRALRPAN